MDDIVKRVLIIGDREPGTENFMNKLSSLGWTASLVDVDDCRSDYADKLDWASVGIVIFNEKKLGEIDSIEKIISHSACEWVAVLKKSDIATSAMRKNLKKLFYAYQTHPVHYGHIDCLLNHAAAIINVSSDDSPCSGDTERFMMVGKSSEMEKTLSTVKRIATVDAPVFISGESGTGKELAARSIHELSKRAAGPFIAVNCGALPSELIQSELFGHEKGAFTGANQRKIGRIESASAGTLFLDEIGDLPLDMQVNLLRFLEDHKIQRVGGIEEIAVDVRILAATHIDLEKAVNEGKFREDLYHRLNVLQVFIPPLRDRQEDIELLCNFFFKKFSDEKAGRVKGFSKESITRMKHYPWPGNIRELINRVRRAMVMCEGRLIKPDDLGLERRHSYRQPISLEQARDMAECDVIKAALARNKNNIQRASAELGVSRVTLYRLIEKHGISRSEEKNGATLEHVPASNVYKQVSTL